MGLKTKLRSTTSVRAPTSVKRGPPTRTPTARRDELPVLTVTRRQVADMLGMSIDYVRKLERDGILNGFRFNVRSVSGQVFFRYADVVALIDNAVEAAASGE